MKMKIKKALRILTTATVIGCLCACSSSESSSPGTTAADTTTAQSTTTETSGSESEKDTAKADTTDFAPIRDKSETDGKIHVIAKGLTAGNAFWNTVRQSLMDIDESSEIGGTDVVIYSSASFSDTNGQLELLETVMAGNPMAVVIAPLDKDAPATLLEQAYDKGIPVVLFDDEINSQKYDYRYATDNYNAAYALAKEIGEKMGGEGTYATLSASAQAAGEEARIAGFVDCMTENYPNIKHVDGGTNYCNYDYQQSYAYMQDLLTVHDDIDCVYASFQNMLISSIVAMQEAGYKAGDIITCCFDSDKDTEILCEEGWVSAFVQQSPYDVVKDAVIQAYKMGIGDVERTGEPQFEGVRYMFITPENISTEEAKKFINPVEISEDYDIELPQ